MNLDQKTVNKIDIGGDVHAVLQELIDTCMLLQASRGGGKSWLMRRLMELISGLCQQIVIDLEGEFVSLREKYPFALLSVSGGDIPLNPRHAATYARKFMESGMSVVIDISDLMPADRAIFVRDFLHELMNLPKHLYHPLLLYIDEGHVFCPQDEGAVSYEAVIDVAARGRKRDIGLVLATQRVSKLHKDVAAELLNKVIGRTGQDIDQARAAKELDWKPADKSQLRKLAPGEFYCFGPALQEDIVKFTVGPVKTSHGKKRLIGAAAPPTPQAIKAVLQSLQDLPAEAEQELATKEQLQAEIERLKGLVSRQKQGDPARYRVLAEQLQEQLDAIKADRRHRQNRLDECMKYIAPIGDAIQKIYDIMDIVRAPELLPPPMGPHISSPAKTIPEITDEKPVKTDTKPPKSETKVQKSETILTEKLPDSSKPALGKCSRLILSFLAKFPDRSFSRTQIAIPIGYTPDAGGFKNNISELSTRGMISRDGGIRIAPCIKDIEAEIGGFEPWNFRVGYFREKLTKCEQEIFDVVLASPHGKFSRQTIAERTASKYAPDAGGFKNSVSHLTTIGILVRDTGVIQLNPELLEFL